MDNDDLLSWLGLRRKIDFTKHKWVGGLLGFAVFALTLALLCIGFGVIGHLIKSLFFASESSNVAEDVRNLGLATGAVIGVPFLIWRSYVAQKQVDVSEQGLAVDRLSNAVENLGSEHEIVRIGALYGLAALSEDMHIDDGQVSNLIAASIRTMARHRKITDFEDSIAPVEEDCWSRSGSAATELDFLKRIDEMNAWAKRLERPSEELQVAITLLGQLRRNERYRIDLSNCNLTNLKFTDCDFSNFNFYGSRLDGSQFVRCTFNNVQLRGKAFQENWSNQDGPSLFVLSAATLRCCLFSNCVFEETDASGTAFDCSNFFRCTFKKCDLSSTSFVNSSFDKLRFLGCLMYLTFLDFLWKDEVEAFQENHIYLKSRPTRWPQNLGFMEITDEAPLYVEKIKHWHNSFAQS